MPKASPALFAFNAGELSELALGRIDLDAYQRGLSRCVNMIQLPQGGVTRRPGTKYVATVRNSAKPVWLIDFIFSDDDALMLVLNDGYIRFFKDRAAVESSPGVPYEVAHPWADADLADLDWVQSGDVLYVVHPDYAPRLISRFADTNWTVTTATFTEGPFMDENVTATTVAPSVMTGSGTLTASTAIFDTDHAGALFLLWAKDLSVANMSPWEPSKAYSSATPSRVYYNGRIYVCATSGTSGTVAPVHEEGSRWDGLTGSSAKWTFESSLYGIVRIDLVTSGTTANMTVLKRLPNPLSGSSTDRWAFGAWSAFDGYPSSVTFYQDRLTFAGSASQPDTVWMSGTGDYLNFAPRDSGGLVTADLGVSVTTSSQSVNRAKFLMPDGVGVLVGTTGGEFLVTPATSNEPLSQSNVRAVPQTTHGSTNVRPVKIGPSTMFVQKGGTVLREAAYSYQDDRIVADDTTLLNPYILKGGVAQMAFAQSPFNVLWVVRTDGALVGLTYNRAQEVSAWHRHTLGGTDAAVKSVGVIPSPDGMTDDLWMAASRTIGGVTVQFVEYMCADWDLDDAGADAYYVDAGVTLAGAGSTITGLSHLNGETVQCWVGGASHPDLEVSGGSVTLNANYTTRTAGLACWPDFRTVRIEAGAGDGTSQGKTKRFTNATFRVFNSLAFQVGSEDRKDTIQFRTNGDPMSSAVNPYTGDTEPMPWPEGNERDGYICVTCEQPSPLTIVAIWPQVVTQDR